MPEEFIFFAVIIFFSIIESISRSRKARQQEQMPAPPDTEPDTESEEWWRVHVPETDLPTYDADPSYDDQVGRESTIQPYEAPRVAEKRSMLPSDLFEELAGLAEQLEQKNEGAKTLSLPRQSPPIPVPEPVPDRAPAPVRVGRNRVARTGPHEIHLAHAGYGTDPSERAKSEQDGLDPLAERLSENAAAIRMQLLSHSRGALRQAVILQEVLGKPVSLRDE